MTDSGVIGDNNALLWHIAEDMRRFRTITLGSPVIMGRKTYESIGRPLPGRTNIVVTRQQITIEGCIVAPSLAEAIAACPQPCAEIFIIGGAQIYAQALPIADRLYLTVVHREYEGDTSFPAWCPDQWTEIRREEFASGQDFDAPFTFIDLHRRNCLK